MRGIRVIFDTNIWISYLIGKRLHRLTKLIVEQNIQIVLSEELLAELKIVASRTEFEKYFKPEAINDLMAFLDIVGDTFEVTVIPSDCRDAKDDFLLGLINSSKANYLVTGDKDLLVLNPYKQTEIITPTDFQKMIESI